MRRIETGDLLIVARLDRLARSTRDLLNILHQLTEKGAKFKSLHDPWCDTSTPQGELLVTIVAGFATFERHLIKARTDDGRKRAKARGARFGRPRKLDQHQRQEALQRLANGETLVDVYSDCATPTWHPRGLRARFETRASLEHLEAPTRHGYHAIPHAPGLLGAIEDGLPRI